MHRKTSRQSASKRGKTRQNASKCVKIRQSTSSRNNNIGITCVHQHWPSKSYLTTTNNKKKQPKLLGKTHTHTKTRNDAGTCHCNYTCVLLLLHDLSRYSLLSLLTYHKKQCFWYGLEPCTRVRRMGRPRTVDFIIPYRFSPEKISDSGRE